MGVWLVKHDSHREKAGDVFEGDELPWYLAGKAVPTTKQVFEVATPAPAPAPAKKPRAKKGE